MFIAESREQSPPVWPELCAKNLLIVRYCKKRLLAEEYGINEFKASPSWLLGFKTRYKLASRTKSNQGQIAPEDSLELAREFGLLVQQKATELGVTEIWNADQTPVNFEMIPKKTIDEKGTKTVWIRCCGKDKERVSVMLLASSSGAKKKPSIVFRQQAPTTVEASQENREVRNGFGPRVWAKFKGAVSQSGCQIHANSKAWFTGPIIAKWLNYHFAFNTEPLLLLLGRVHWTQYPRIQGDRQEDERHHHNDSTWVDQLGSVCRHQLE